MELLTSIQKDETRKIREKKKLKIYFTDEFKHSIHEKFKNILFNIGLNFYVIGKNK